MNSFLSHVADYIYKKHNTNFQNVTIIMPNRRSCLFLEKELASKIEETSWLPQIISLNDWIKAKSTLNSIDELLGIIKLYQAFKQIYSNYQISFDKFYFTGQIILNDFNDIDSECVDAEKLFVNLSDLKEINKQFSLEQDFFDILSNYLKIFKNASTKDENNQDAANIESYIEIWQGLLNLYKLYRENLINEKLAYDGLLIRYFIEKEFKNIINDLNNETFYIIGFNILKKAEYKLFEMLNKNTNVSFLWDYDDEYIKNEQYSAGFYLRDLLKKFPKPNDFNLNTSNLSTLGSNDNERKVRILSMPNEIMQAKYTASLIRNNSQTAIVLADESLLPIVMSSLPDNVNKVNVTMGFPIRQTALYTLMQQLFNLQKQVKKKDQSIWIPINAYIELLYHPFLCNDKSVQTEIDSLINNSNDSFYFLNLNEKKFVENTDNSVLSILQKLCYTTTNNNNCLRLLLQLLVELEKKLQKNPETLDNQLEIQAIRKIYNAFKAFDELITNNNIKITDSNLFTILLSQILQNQKIELFGEPLESLQIMGFKETRLLDFENVIVLSLNDKIFPGDKFTPTFILSSLRKYFGLTTPEKREAIDAYNFYRLIQRSKNIYLLYSQFIGNEEVDKSPYLIQLLFNSKWNINEEIYHDKIGKANKIPTIKINKESLGEKWGDFLKNIKSNGLSQKSISTYIQCPLKFYFENVEKLTDQPLFPDENIEKIFGLIFHEVIQELFKNKKNKHVEINDLEKIQKQIPNTIEQIFNNKFQYRYTQVLLLKEQLKTLLDKFFETEKQKNSHFPATIIQVEDYLETSLNNIKLYGKPDMIIKNDRGVFILDFKTGAEKDVLFEEIDELFNQNFNLIYAFQLAFYSFLYLKNMNRQTQNLFSENIYIKSYNEAYKKVLSKKIRVNGQKKLQKQNVDFSNVFKTFEEKLVKKLNELLDIKEPFTQTSDVKNCEYCDFVLICRKNE